MRFDSLRASATLVAFLAVAASAGEQRSSFVRDWRHAELAIHSFSKGVISGTFRASLRPTPGASVSPIPLDGTFRATYVYDCDLSVPCLPIR